MPVFHPLLRLTVFILLTVWAVNLNAIVKTQRQQPLQGHPTTTPDLSYSKLEDAVNPELFRGKAPWNHPLTRRPLSSSLQRAEQSTDLQPGIPYSYQRTIGKQLIDTVVFLDGTTGINSLKTLLDSSRAGTQILVLVSGHNGPIAWDQSLRVDQAKKIFIQGISTDSAEGSSSTALPEILLSSSLLSDHAALTVAGSASLVLASHIDFVTKQDREAAPTKLEPVFKTEGKATAVLDYIHLEQLLESQPLYKGNVQYEHISLSSDSEPPATPTSATIGGYRHSGGLGVFRLLASLWLPTLGVAQSITSSLAPAVTPFLEPGLMAPTMAPPNIGLIVGVVTGVTGVIVLGVGTIFTINEVSRWKSGKRPRILQLYDKCRRAPTGSTSVQATTPTPAAVVNYEAAGEVSEVKADLNPDDD
ncbi:hypothetical protein M3P05_07915 [Sansalvadorimonas sp. 2012CJ34-2]|uniref:Transmembrane protein n=1 Tax=Parendozoicomonas callyspongiae TaxID=2942213 RepID=A0ABT0PF78_9GAMM|nr:hypothetical protein [Sansalvadorimonas sp. 2012CJ34-2]MCL6269866.1 hypothetical protein [Sansalvadorimonas sp. 2012CJ34-2]